MIIDTFKTYFSFSKKEKNNEEYNNNSNKNFLNLFKDKTSIVVGRNGAGKSTFLKNFFEYLILNNYIKIAFVSRFDMPDSVKKYTAYEYFKWSLENNIFDWFNKVNKYMKMFNFNFDAFSSFISELSGGEKRLIILIKELLLNHDILIIDEPELYLSKNNEEKLIKILKNHFQSKTLILATHSINFSLLGQQTFLVKNKKLEEIENIDNENKLKKILWNNKEVFDAKFEFK